MAAAPCEQRSDSSALFLTRCITRLTASKVQLVFFLFLLVLFPPLVPFLNALDGIVQLRKAKNPEYPWPDYQDLKLSLYVAAVLYLLWGFLKKSLRRILEPHLDPKYTGEDRNSRAERAADNVFKGTYYLFIVFFGYFVTKDSPFLPPTLGGSGSMDKMFEGFPYQAFDTFPLIRVYLLVQLGYHLFSFIDHMMAKPKNNFMEMLLHHCLTLLLISLAYFMNYVAVSHLVLFLHDISDLFLDIGRAAADTTCKTLVKVMGGLLVTSWMYTRLYLFPFDLMQAAYYNNIIPDEELYGKDLLGAMLHALLILHIYWFILIVKMFYRVARKKEVDIGERFDKKTQ